jgi:hypothetical protein
MLNPFLDTYLKIYYSSFPQKKKKIEIFDNSKEWITTGIKTSCKHKIFNLITIFNDTIGTAACEACSATCNWGSNSAFALGPRKITENNRAGWYNSCGRNALIHAQRSL